MAGRSRKESDRLAEYRAKRVFDRITEPTGDDETKQDGTRFVVQLHRARRRHYDLRLEIGDVLVSWAVPKGPTLDPKSRRLAVHVEDHPLEYVNFEGVIPTGEYGGGDVIVWDRGTWLPVDTGHPMQAIEAGNLHFDLFGEKLAGRFVLIQRGQDGGDKPQWLLMHKKDEHAQLGWDPDQYDRSVLSGRTNREVAAAPTSLWRSDLPPDKAEVPANSGELSAKTSRKQPSKKTERTEEVRRNYPPPARDELAALDDLRGKGTWQVAGRDMALTNLDKVLFPAMDKGSTVTKRDLVRYYAEIAPVILPYLADRPLNTHRFPNGVDKPGFWHKEVPSHAPDWLRRWRYADAGSGETQWYVVPDDVAALAWLANYAAIEFHPWSSRTTDIHYPTWALFDIDPGTDTAFEDVLVLARLHRTALEHLGVVARPKVSGQRGLQIWVPIKPRYTYAETRGWVEKVSRAIGEVVPDMVSWAWRKDQRRGRARLDYTQNVINKTLVAPYSVRPWPGAPVSVPIEWDELDDPDLAPDRWTIRTVLDRLAVKEDPFVALLGVEQELPAL